MKRIILETTVVLLIFTAILAGVGVGVAYWDATDNHHWYTALLCSALGLGTAIAGWSLAALMSLAVEIADSLRTLVANGNGLKPPQPTGKAGGGGL